MEQTWADFQGHFTHGDKERLRLLTAANAGYHGAHAAIAKTETAAVAKYVQATPTPRAHPQQVYCGRHHIILLLVPWLRA